MSQITCYPIGGVGIKFTDDMLRHLFEDEVFTAKEWIADPGKCLNKLKVNYVIAGNLCKGSFYYYLFVDGYSLLEINNNVDEFINKLSKFGIMKDIEDLDIISDLRIW